MISGIPPEYLPEFYDSLFFDKEHFVTQNIPEEIRPQYERLVEQYGEKKALDFVKDYLGDDVMTEAPTEAQLRSASMAEQG